MKVVKLNSEVYESLVRLGGRMQNKTGQRLAFSGIIHHLLAFEEKNKELFEAYLGGGSPEGGAFKKIVENMRENGIPTTRDIIIAAEERGKK